MIRVGIFASQARKYAGYMPGGFAALSSWTSTDASNDAKVEGVTGEWYNSNLIQKILFISDTCSAIAATISNPQRATAGYANKTTAGYSLGGETAAGVATNKIDRLLFAGESISTLGTTLSSVVFAFAGAANGTTAGYTFGGYGASSPINTINKMPFSNETNAAIAATIGTARHNSGALSNGPSAIYNTAGIADNSEIRKLTLSNETMSTLGTTLSSVLFSTRAGTSNVGTAGYLNSHNSGTSLLANNTDKLLYSNETRSTFSSGTQSLAVRWSGCVTNSNIASYLMGGLIYDSANRVNTTRINQKFPFTTETFSNLNSNMTLWQRQAQGYAYSQ